MELPQKIRELMDRFEAQKQTYTSGTYNETMLRRDFLDPMLRELGWDIDNTKGSAEAYREVIHEDAVKVGTATKAPDYSCRIGGVRKFFVEAKKPSVHIKGDPAPAYQLRRYAWSAGLPLSILSDFQEFAVYDCRQKPKPTDGPAVGRIFYCTYDQYAEHWEFITSVFSQDAIYRGSFDRFAEEATKKRGTAAVDDEFLKEIESWREMLAKNIALRNPTLSEQALNFAVQKTIDRIIFLRICEDRGIEEYEKLRKLVKKEGIYAHLKTHFKDADARYNSGLFHFKSEKDIADAPDTWTLDLSIDDAVLKKIITHLYFPDSPYEFSVLPADLLGHVYEQFLGKVIRLTAGHQAKVEEKPEVRKAGGVYYTPTYIVQYIVEQTVGKLLEGKTPKQVEKLRIVDPACGSGSFLLGAYQRLLDWHLQWYMEHDPKKYKKELYLTAQGDWKLSTAERKRILLSNLYGVDIDAQAVEVTKLSLLLKVLEGETHQTVQMSLLKERVLPSLSNNIKCGNSLIGPDFYAQHSLFTDSVTMRSAAKRSVTKGDTSTEDFVNPFDWKAEFADVFAQGGFDAVIGNPPYVGIGKDGFSQQEIEYLMLKYPVAQYKMDLFHLFIQRGLDHVNGKGLLGYIIPNPWMTLQFNSKLREYILLHSSIQEIDVFGDRVFQDANVHTMLLFLKKEKPSNSHEIKVKQVPVAASLSDISPLLISQSTWLVNEDFAFETRLTGPVGSFISKLLKRHAALQDVARVSLGCQAYNSSKHSKADIRDRIFHADEKLGSEYLPELAGSDVGRFFAERKRGQWIKYGPWLHDYRSMDWLTGPRILVREVAGKSPNYIQAAYVEQTYCNYKTILNVNPKDGSMESAKFLVGLLNSSLLSFVYPFISNKMLADTFPRISVKDLKRLPIRTIDFTKPEEKKQHDHLVSLVDRMLDLHKKLPAMKTPHEVEQCKRQIAATDREIDDVVFELYGVSEEERKIVDSISDY